MRKLFVAISLLLTIISINSLSARYHFDEYPKEGQQIISAHWVFLNDQEEQFYAVRIYNRNEDAVFNDIAYCGWYDYNEKLIQDLHKYNYMIVYINGFKFPDSWANFNVKPCFFFD